MRQCWPVVLVACKFSAGVGGGADGGSDGSVDTQRLDAFDDRCFGSGSFYVCLESVPDTDVVLGGNFSTTTCSAPGVTAMMGASGQVCVIAGRSVHLPPGAVAGIFGTKPLVLAATTRVAIEGTLDAASSVGSPGPGANPAALCVSGNGEAQVTGGGGGAGGSFGSKGANGGAGTAGGGGPSPDAAPTPQTSLRGGCPGGTGGGTGTPTLGGPGGGAVYLVSRGDVEVSGAINASGGGGIGATLARTGGGGGGSGGTIVFHAALLSVATGAKIIANGGGGGGGASDVVAGVSGENPRSTQPVDTPASGGDGGGVGAEQGDGGDGAAGASAASPGEAHSGGGGGGGGGGHGVIRVLAGGSIPATSVSPGPT